MIKRIPCRVISSEPLSNRTNVFLHIDKLNNNRHGAFGGNLQIDRIRNLFTYSNSLNIVQEYVDYGLIGQLLDCYA